MKMLLELKRRLTWLWRLAVSNARPLSQGLTPAVWLFDTLHQPDGAVLQRHVDAIAREHDLAVRAFGPSTLGPAGLPGALVRFVVSLPHVASAGFDDAFCALAAKVIAEKTHLNNAVVLLVGSSKGTFARAVVHACPRLRVWEIQHGLLDPSYFPMSVERFFARSSKSAALVSRLAPAVQVDRRFNCLEAPGGSVVRLEDQTVRQLQCFSKNPGGGCSAHELADFEAACARYARQQGWFFSLHLHPRDNLFKLVRRHRRLAPLLWIAAAYGRAQRGARLVVSAYSSALVSNSSPGDLVLNIDIGKPDGIILHEYGWLPTLTAASLINSNRNIDVFLRTE